VDDERPVIEGITLIVKRELGLEFEIAGTATSGREAIEKAAALAPDIVLMDVRMPGISGLDAIREMRRRGGATAFVLVTAYERFDIAREAVELGVLDYLLKPVSKDRLALSLRSAAAYVDRRGELERKEIEHREREERSRSFVEAAFLHGIVLGESFGGELGRYREALGLGEGPVLVAAAAFIPPAGSLDPASEARAVHAGFRETLRYKTNALVGPLIAGRCLVLLPLKDEGAADASRESLLEVVGTALRRELAYGYLRLGFARTRSLDEASAAWSEALAELLGSGHRGADAELAAKPYDDDEAFLEALIAGAPERAGLSLDRILEALGGFAVLPAAARYRLIVLFGSAARVLARRGFIDRGDAAAMMDLEDLRNAGEGLAFELAVRSRFSRLSGIMARSPRWTAPVSMAVAYIEENFGRQLSLELAADVVGISPNRLSRLFVEETGHGFSDFLIEYRIERAKELLSMPGASIKQVSISCGYPDPNYFSRLFKKVTGQTPSAFSSGSTEVIDEKD
jgi:two-component system, response regulator YesN